MSLDFGDRALLAICLLGGAFGLWALDNASASVSDDRVSVIEVQMPGSGTIVTDRPLGTH